MWTQRDMQLRGSSGSWRSSIIEKHQNKLSPKYDPSPCEVIDRNRGEVT